MKRFTYRVELAYDGTAFAGFAHVPGERSVLSTLREALISIAPGFWRLASAGRTDRNVSATGQVLSFITRDFVDPDAVVRAIDSAHPALCALDVRRVSDSFHAQFSASSRRYVYLHADDGSTDVARIDRMLCALLGRRDFTAFARETPLDKKTVKTLWDARARRVTGDDGPTYVRFDLAGDAFLRRQVRVLVATALREASTPGPANDEVLVELAATLDRRTTAQPAPPVGLYLTKVGYEPVKIKHR